ncbi:MAG: TonB-dependent receptor, partial [Flavobacteriales bacterium]
MYQAYLSKLFIFLFSLISITSISQTAVISGEIKDKTNDSPLPFVTVVLKSQADSSLVTGTITDDNGMFQLNGIHSGNYILEASFLGYVTNSQNLFVGNLNQFFNVGIVYLTEDSQTLDAIEITDKQDEISSKMDKKVYSPEDNVVQNGGTALQAMQNLPGVTVQDGKVQLRGSDKVMILVDGKQTALTGIGNQSGLENIPASAIEKIEIINNPSAKYDANGTSGIINIVFKKDVQEGFNGKVGL